MRLIYIVAAMVPGLLDIAIKHRVEEHVELGQSKTTASGRLEIRKIYNYGFAMNLLSGKKSLIKAGSLLAGLILAAYEVKLILTKGSAVGQIGGALAIGGALSNICDRFFKGYVVDYFGFKTKGKTLNNLTFNLGDICIAVGSLMIVLSAGGNQGYTAE